MTIDYVITNWIHLLDQPHSLTCYKYKYKYSHTLRVSIANVLGTALYNLLRTQCHGIFSGHVRNIRPMGCTVPKKMQGQSGNLLPGSGLGYH